MFNNEELDKMQTKTRKLCLEKLVLTRHIECKRNGGKQSVSYVTSLFIGIADQGSRKININWENVLRTTNCGQP